MIKCDLHTHTVFCDGKNTPEEMVLSAIEKGLDTTKHHEMQIKIPPHTYENC